jgi:S1-C subfamily serine protease
VKCALRVVSGARAGHREVFEKSYIGIGRHPLSDLRFDAEQDLDASSRHAAIVKSGETFLVRDLGSTNGTFVNGVRIGGDQVLGDGDMLRFGVHGPEVAFQLIHESHDEVIMPKVEAPGRPSAATSASPPPAPAAPPPRQAPPRPAPPPRQAPPAPPAARAPATPGPDSRTGILRAELADQRRRSRIIALALLVVMLGALGLIYWQGRTAAGDRHSTRTMIDSLRGELAVLRRLQTQADSEATRLRRDLAAERDAGRRTSLQARLNVVENRSSHIAAAQAVNWPAVVQRNRPAVAMIYVKFPDSSMWSGTAFSVDSRGRMLTNRHLVMNRRGQRAVEIAVQFSGSPDVHPARIERISRSDDLATILLESAGPHPAVLGFAETLPTEGDPIGLIGYPFGRDLPQGEHPTASLFNGSISRIIPDSLLQLDAWSGTGASGSPIFDRAGRVVGVEFGGVAETGGRVVLGLPIGRARALLGP